MPQDRRTAVFVLFLIAFDRQTARAADVIVVESHVGSRPSDLGPSIDPVVAALKSRGYETDVPTLAHRIETRVSRSGVSLGATDVTEFTKLAEGGFSHWLAGDFQPAVDTLSRALEMVRQKPATVADDQRLRDSVLKCLIGLALAHKRLGNADKAAEYMAEMIRSFLDRGLNRALFGPEAHDLYLHVKAELDQAGPGTLRVEVDDETAAIFVDERYQSLGRATVTGLPAGRYRVYVRKGSTPGRVHEVDVAPGSDQRLAISWAFDAALHTGSDFVGFTFSSGVERSANEAAFAVTLARALDAQGVVVLGAEIFERRRALKGSVLSLDSGRPYRVGFVALEPAAPGEAQLRGLASFLAGGEPVPGLIVPGETTSPQMPRERRPYRLWKWAALGTGLAAAAGGITLIAMDGEVIEDGDRHLEGNDTLLPGIALTTAGVALLGTSVALFLLDRPRGEPRAVSLVPTREGDGFVLSLGGRF